MEKQTLFSIISGCLLVLAIIFMLISYKEFSTLLCILALTTAFIPHLLNKEKIGYICSTGINDTSIRDILFKNF